MPEFITLRDFAAETHLPLADVLAAAAAADLRPVSRRGDTLDGATFLRSAVFSACIAAGCCPTIFAVPPDSIHPSRH